MGSGDFGGVIKALAVCRCDRPGEVTCYWIDLDGKMCEQVVKTDEGEDVPVFELVSKPGVTVQFTKPGLTMEMG